MVVLLIMRPRLSPFEHNEKQGWHTCTTLGGSIAIAIYPFSTILGTQRQSSSNVLEQKISLMKEHFLGGYILNIRLIENREKKRTWQMKRILLSWG